MCAVDAWASVRTLASRRILSKYRTLLRKKSTLDQSLVWISGPRNTSEAGGDHPTTVCAVVQPLHTTTVAHGSKNDRSRSAHLLRRHRVRRDLTLAYWLVTSLFAWILMGLFRG